MQAAKARSRLVQPFPILLRQRLFESFAHENEGGLHMIRATAVTCHRCRSATRPAVRTKLSSCFRLSQFCPIFTDTSMLPRGCCGKSTDTSCTASFLGAHPGRKLWLSQHSQGLGQTLDLKIALPLPYPRVSQPS